MMPKWIVGIDYSMSCPSITISDTTQPFSFNNCVIYYTSEKIVKKEGLPNIHGSRLGNYTGNEERFNLISEWAISCITETTQAKDVTVFIEDYSFGSKGKVFHIAENAGLVKHNLWKLNIPIYPIAPTVIKKFAFGKGNATKDDMYQSFLADTKTNLMSIYQPKAASVGSPVGDIIDSYYICKFGVLEGHKYPLDGQ